MVSVLTTQSSSWCAQESRSQMAVLCTTTGTAVLGCLSRSVVHHIVTGVLNGLQPESAVWHSCSVDHLFPGKQENYLNRKYNLNGQMLPFAQLVLVLISCFIAVRSSENEGQTFLLVCDIPELLCWKRWEREREALHVTRHCTWCYLVFLWAFEIGHFTLFYIILGMLGKTRLFHLLL